MNRQNKLAATTLAAFTFLATSAFADSRPQSETWRNSGASENRLQNDRGYDNRDGNRGYNNGDNRDGRRGDNRSAISGEGRIRSINREGNGYRLQIEGNNRSFFLPEMNIRNAPRGRGRAADLRVGVSIRLGGYLDPRGYVYADSCDWVSDYGYNNDNYSNNGYRSSYVSGVVTAVDYRRNVMELRDGRSGRYVTVAMLRNDGRRNRRIDLDDLRRGDRVTLAGEWGRGDVFQAWRVDSVTSGRW